MTRRKRRETSPAPDSGLEPGELVPLAEGPVAGVLAGVDQVTGEAFALKVYRGKLDHTARTAVEAELSQLRPLRSRAPMLVADRVQSHNGNCALRMELCAQSLPELVASFGPLSVADAMALGESIATAVAAAHRVGAGHGGVTPGNVLFRGSGEAVLSDFGLALRDAFPYDDARDVRYLPPETVRDGTADERSDIYGIGAVLYLALSARPPHTGRLGEPPGEQVLRVLDATPPPIDRGDMPPGLPALLSALLAKDPQERPADAADIATRLAEMAAATPVPPVPADAPRDDLTAATVRIPRETVRAADSLGVNGPHPATPSPAGQPVLIFRSTQRQPKVTPGVVVLAAAGALCIGVLVALLMLLNRAELPAQSAPDGVGTTTPREDAVEPVDLELNEPVDRGEFVQLSWESSTPLEFAVIVVGEGEKARAVLAHRKNTLRVQVDPERGYCFAVQGNDGDHVYESDPRPIRGATCSR